MPLSPSFYSSCSDFTRSRDASPISTSSGFTTHYPSTLSLFNGNSYSSLSSLPPPIPQHTRRMTPIRRTHTTHLDLASRRPVFFETRPLRNLTVLSTPSPSLTRSPSPIGSDRSTPVRRIFPQTGAAVDLDELHAKDEAPVVFDANLTFVLGTKGKMKHRVTPVPAYLDEGTTSNCLSNKIADFLKRTDHVMDEWKRLGHKESSSDAYDPHSIRRNAEDRRIIGRSRSATNILIKGFQLFSRSGSARSSVARDASECTEAEADELTELTADLAEEHSTSTLATERLDAETSERMRIERELIEVQTKNKLLQDTSEQLELELLYAKSDLNGISEEDEEGDGDGGVYKQRYERVRKELEFTKKRLQQQHEDDLEQLVALKKQLEKKLTDAYEEVEEQRQVVGQWKRKVQKVNGETNDLRLLLEEQSARNNMLEKKQRKFDSETQSLQDELRQERTAKDRLAREKETTIAEKFTLEANLADVRLELDLKEDKLQALKRELDELTYGGKTEEEVTILRKQKIDCERRLHDQEEELDELAGQVQLLEQAKLRLEMTLESQRKEGKREAQQRDDELEEVRCNAQKKVKALEAQLENEHEERTILLREKHELERRLTALAEADRNDRAGDEALLNKLKRDLKRTKVLLRDTQSQLERLKSDGPGKALVRQLRNQIEDLECARSIALKSKQSLETDLVETQTMLEDANRLKSEAEEKSNSVLRERSDLQAQLEENEEELAEVMKKYKAAVQQMSLDQMTLQEQVSLVSELESERNHLRDQLSELASKLESVETMGEASSNLHVKRMELKTKELESKLELEQTTRSRLEVQINRLKEAVDKLQTEIANSRTKEQLGQEQIRKLQKNLRELKEECNQSASKEADFLQKRKDLEKRCELAETETAAAKADLRLALKRIEDLQSAIQGELEDSPSEQTDSEQDSYTSDESVSTFLSNSKLHNAVKSDRNSIQIDSRRSSTSSSMHGGKDYSYA
uniref:Myosin tail domain-containing protein n=1 Tax=Photinus pyralis TaxID=7054 RepID=A0A1Y1KV81_PHOPY